MKLNEQQLMDLFRDVYEPIAYVELPPKKPAEPTVKKLTEQQLKTMYLRVRQQLPLEIVAKMSLRRIRAWYEYWEGQVYVSLGGKDSHALLHQVRSIYPDVPAVFVDTGLEYPEVRELNMRTPNCLVLKPEISFPQVIGKYGWPVVSKKQAGYIGQIQNRTGKNEATRRLRLSGIKSDGTLSRKSMISKRWQYLVSAPFKISDKCCHIMKTEPLDKHAQDSMRKPITGEMASEGDTRENKYLERGCNYYNEHNPRSTPIAFWSEQHVLQYIKTRGVEIAACYGEIVETETGLKLTGEQRTGCMWCAFGAHLDESPNRFERMEQTHPKQWKYCMEKLGLKEVLQYCGIPWGKEQMDLFDKEVA